MKKKKIIIILSFLVVIILGYYISQGSRFKKTITLEPKKNQEDNSSKNTSDNNNTTNYDSSVTENAPKIEVKPDDCHNDCRKFTKDDEKEYCQEICGLTSYFEDAEEEGGSAEDCTDAKGIQKDYCLKDIAVGNKDFKTCDEIKDANIKKSCQSRITEDILESQPSQSDGSLGL